MTQQYQEESINGQPGTQSLRLVPSAVPVPVAGPNDAALFLPTAAADAVIEGDAIEIAGGPALGNIYQVNQPGLYSVSFSSTDAGLLGAVTNLLRGANQGAIGAILYPSPDFVSAPGVIGVGSTTAPGDVLGTITTVSALTRISGADLVDPPGGVNTNRQIVVGIFPPAIAGLAVPGAIEIAIARVSI
jgi:hypothetical protein